MKPICCFLLILWCATGLVSAQEKSRGDRQKSLTFQPGSKVPDETSKPAAPAPIPSSANNTPPPNTGPNDSAGQIIAIFFGLLQKNEIDQAYESLTKNSKIAERPEEVKALKQKTKEAIEVFGPVQAFELADSKTVGSRLLRRTYLSLNRDFPLRWRFYFYLSDNITRLIDLRVDDRVTGMFDEPDEPRSTDSKP